jgi:UDPglucose 6-dehydrogenase
LEYVKTAFRDCGEAIREKPGYHTVVLMSTVLPGATRTSLLPIIEEASGKKAGRDFCVLYGPQFVALGTVIQDFLNPSFVLIGECKQGEGEALEALYKDLMKNHAPCVRMSIENAELTKIAVNTFVTTKISFANTLADLCEAIPGGDVDTVSAALGLDRRIGGSCLRGSLGYGGPCFPRDNLAFSYLAAKLGIAAPLAEATDFINRSRPGKIIKRLSDILRAGQRAAVLGLAYKPFTPVVEESQAIYLLQELLKIGIHVTAYDPLANEEARLELGDKAIIADSLASCIADAEVVVVATPDPAFTALLSNDLAGKTIIDLWRILDGARLAEANAVYVPLGRGSNNLQIAR